jgi:hypothetical protein
MSISSSSAVRWAGVRLAVALLLFGAEFWVCILAHHPRVGPEYRAHYMTQPMSCWIPENRRAAANRQPLPSDFDVGTLPWPEVCRVLRAGWAPEHWGAWTTGPMALLRIPVTPATHAIRLTVIAPGYLRKPQDLRITQEGVASGRAPLLARVAVPPSGQTVIAVPVDPAAGAAGQVELRLRIATPRSAFSFGAGDDMRMLGIGLLHVRVEPGPAGRPANG